MRLLVKRDGRTVDEFRFAAGPIYIGRHVNSQVFLPHRAVSRQHAVLFATPEGKWMVEDLDSANKTYLKDKPIHKAEIKTGDILRIADFTIEVDLEASAQAEQALDLEDTLITTAHKQQVIVRKPDVEQAADIRLPAKRANDFMQAAEAICKANGLDEVLKTLLTIILKQFSAMHSWCALRNEPTGPMTRHAGRTSDGRRVELSRIKLNQKITEAVEKGQFLLLPQASASGGDEKIRSAMIAPVLAAGGCFGVLYVDNGMERQAYTLSDLDYFMLLAIHTAAILENF